MSIQKIIIPNMGDFENIEIIEVLVKEGQSIKKNDSLITLESDKSSVEVPSTLEGVIEKINIKIGDKVNQGDLILTLKTKEIKKSDEILEKKEQVDQSSALKQEVKKSVIISSNQNIKPASPKVRKFARELGSNIMQIPGSQRSGRVSEEDVKKFIKSQAGVNKEQVEKKIYKDEYSHEEFGEVEIKEIPRVKKLAATYLVNSWNTIPHVTNHDEADITEMEDFRNSLTDIYTGKKKKITPIVFVIKALVASLKKFPSFNSSIDEIENGKITLKKYFHIGIAVDTPHGLMVPKIRNVNNKNITNISNELKTISEQCRNLKINKKEFLGGSMTITSLGGIGGSFFTPIINFPEVAILGIGRSEKKQVFINDKFQTRTMLPISLSYDHRIIDGAEAARFNNDLKENLGKNFAYKLAI